MTWKHFPYLLTLLLALTAPSRGFAAFEAFLKIEGIEGESIDIWHTNWIVTQAFSNSLTRQTSAPLDRVSARSSLLIVKELDKSSPYLLQACATGQRFERAVLECCLPLDTRTVFHELKLGNVVVKQVDQTSGALGPHGRPLEHLVLEYDRITWIYTRLSAVPPARIGSYWDLLHNTGGVLPLPFVVEIVQTQPGNVVLSWVPKKDRRYLIYSSPQVDGVYSLLDIVTPPGEELFRHPLTVVGDALFFKIEEQ